MKPRGVAQRGKTAVYHQHGPGERATMSAPPQINPQPDDSFRR
jgi:hypothetical protein